MMNVAESMVPKATAQMQARCTFFDRRSQPKIHSPRKVDSKKKRGQALHGQGAAEDVADVLGVGGPVHAELQSCTNPVTTPMATLISSRVPKNLVRHLKVGFWFR